MSHHIWVHDSPLIFKLLVSFTRRKIQRKFLAQVHKRGLQASQNSAKKLKTQSVTYYLHALSYVYNLLSNQIMLTGMRLSAHQINFLSSIPSKNTVLAALF